VRLVLALVVSGCGFSAGNSGVVADASDASVEDTFSPESVPVDGPRTDWWDSEYHTRHQITIDTTKLTGPVMSFPVLVRIRNNEVTYAKIGADGASLRFVDVDQQTVIPHEVDTWVSGGNSFVWIKLSMDPAASPRKLWMYYDNPNVTTSSNPAAVFGSWTSVQHMGTTGLADSSGHNHTATSANGGTTPGAGPVHIGNVSDFDGNNDYLELPNENDFDFTAELGVSAWVQISTFNVDYQTIVAKGDMAWRMQRNATTRAAQFGTNNSENLNGTKTVDDNQWHHVAITYDGTTKRLYFDGNLDTSAANASIGNTGFSVRIGENQEAGQSGSPGGYRYWESNMDEVRIGSAERSAAWIKAEFLTVDDMDFADVSPAESY
jgi:biopolymer transport protein ExbB